MQNGICSLEAEWTESLDRDFGVEPLLNFVRATVDRPGRFVHRQLSIADEAERHLRWWRHSSRRRFAILYFSGHGEPEKICLKGKRNALELSWFETVLAGSCRGRFIHFGSCSTLDTSSARLQTFLERTGALGVSGFANEIDWTASALLDVILLAELQSKTLSRPRLRAVKKHVWASARGLAQSLGFRMAVAR
jgi:hypothetical protein